MKSYTFLCLKNLELCAYNTILTLLNILSIIFHNYINTICILMKGEIRNEKKINR